MTSSSHHDGNTRKHRPHGDAAAKKQQKEQQQQQQVKSASKGKARHSATCSWTKHASKRECDCTNTTSRSLPHRKKSVRHVPHEYTPFHHLSLDVMDGIPDRNEHEFGPEPEDGEHGEQDYIGDESTTILTPSYDSTKSTVTAYLDELDEHATFNTTYPYSYTTHDLQYIGNWAQTQEAMDMERALLPDYTSAMNIGLRYATRSDGTSKSF